MDEFARALTARVEDNLTCDACEAQLAEYVEMQVTGRHEGRYGPVERHIQRCPRCAATYRDMLELTRLAYGNALPRPRRSPHFNFSFLEGTTPKSFTWDGLRLVINLAIALWEPPRLAPAYAVKGETPPEEAGDATDVRLPRRFSLDPTDIADVQVTIAVLPDTEATDACNLVAKVEVPSRWPDLSGIEVVLAWAETRLSQPTDESGEVIFGPLPCTALQTARLSVQP